MRQQYQNGYGLTELAQRYDLTSAHFPNRE
jgi:hypothetical protein